MHEILLKYRLDLDTLGIFFARLSKSFLVFNNSKPFGSIILIINVRVMVIQNFVSKRRLVMFQATSVSRQSEGRAGWGGGRDICQEVSENRPHGSKYES